VRGTKKDPFQRPAAGEREQGRVKVIYLYLPEQSWVFLLDIYGKDEKDDLSREEKKVLASLASRIREVVKGRSKRR
jgi:hypothetical protein